MATEGVEQQLRFRWNDHMQHLSKVLMLQRLQEQYCDITLVSEDGFLTKAHQAVLASTSTYFERVLGDIRPEQHPMVVLRGAKLQELTCVLDYMYQGKTQMEQSLVESVLEVADLLEVKGLSGIRSKPAIQKFMAAAPATTTAHPPPPDPPTPPPGTNGGTQGGEDLLHPSSAPLKDADPPQTSGIDLSMAKNEPRSPREVGVTAPLPAPSASREEAQGEEEGLLLPSQPYSTCRKRRRLQDSPSSEDNVDSASDPDWGRIGSKVEEPPHPAADAQPRTVTLTAISTCAAAKGRRLSGIFSDGGREATEGEEEGEEKENEIVKEEVEEEELEEEQLFLSSCTAQAPLLPPPHLNTPTPTRPVLSPPPHATTTTTTPMIEEGRLLRPRNTIKRPMNKYLLFFQDTMQQIKAQHPSEKYHSLTQLVADQWNSLPASEKQKWEAKADHLRMEHRLRHPNYLYSPREAAQQRREYRQLKGKRRSMFCIPTCLKQPHPHVTSEGEVVENGGGDWKLLALSDWHFVSRR